MIRKHPGRSGAAHRSFVKVAAVAAVFVASVVAVPAAGAATGLVTQSLSGTLTATDLANTLVGSGVTVSNVVYTGADGAAGTFSGGGTGDGSIIGFDQGVVLSSGSIANVVGPNVANNKTTNNGQPGDSDLNGLLVGQSTQDAAVLSFDFVANASSISFRYVFASEEYNEYVNSTYNDVFGFFVNGSTLGADCATVDGQPVSVNTINGGSPIGTGASHPELYRNNSLTDPGPATIDTEMDGLTTVLLCQASVVPNQTNTMKLAIADVSDALYDSNVFIEAGSLTTIPPVGTPTNVVGNPSNGSAIVTWTPPEADPNVPIDSFDVTCTATGNPDNSVTTNVAGSETAAQVVGLTNGTEYTCSVRARSGDLIGDYSDPSAPFKPSDGSIAQFVDPNVGGVVNLTPGQSSVGTSGQFVIPAGPASASSALAAGDPIILTASLFGAPGEADVTCGGNQCVGQGIEWSISDPSAVGVMLVKFIETPALTHGANVKTASVYKGDVLLPNCKKKVLKIMCVSDRDRTKGGGWRITIRVDGQDPRGRI
jgi:hypothetical protein